MAVSREKSLLTAHQFPRSLKLPKGLCHSGVGAVGTIRPSPSGMVAASINEEFSVNYPTNIAVEMEQGKLRRLSLLPNKRLDAILKTLTCGHTLSSLLL